MSARIVVIGANGQVGAEVCLRLAGKPGIDLVPVSRTRSGSAFLRSRGVAVMHGSLDDGPRLARMLEGASLVANFALAGGAGKVGIAANQAIIESLAAAAPATTRQVFMSTMAVGGTYDVAGKATLSPYGDLKLANEKSFFDVVGRAGLEGWALRLGHCYGPFQNIYSSFSQCLQDGRIALPDEMRATNVVFCEAIADSLVTIAEGRSGPPGLYDLFNQPQWTWQEVFDHHATLTGLSKPRFERLTAPKSRTNNLKSAVFGMIARTGLRTRLERMLPYLPGIDSEQIRSDFMFNRTVGEIAALSPSGPAPLAAALWPKIDGPQLAGLEATRDLLASGRYAIAEDLPAWPDDIPVGQSQKQA